MIRCAVWRRGNNSLTSDLAFMRSILQSVRVNGGGQSGIGPPRSRRRGSDPSREASAWPRADAFVPGIVACIRCRAVPSRLLQRLADVAGRHDEPSSRAVSGHRSGLGRDDARQAARHRLIADNGRAFEERGEDENVSRRHSRWHLRVREPAQPFNFIQERTQRTGIGRQGAQQLQPPAWSADQPPGFQKGT